MRFDNILKVYTAVVSVMLIVAAIASQTGMIADVIGYSPRNAAAARHSYGIIYPTDFAAHIFYLILAVSCLVYGREYRKTKNTDIWHGSDGLS